MENIRYLNYFIKTCSKLLKKNGLMFVATLNKTLKSYIFAIVGAEYILKWLPIGTHDWNKFVRPKELSEICFKYNLKLNGEKGVVFNLAINQWKTDNDKSVNYISSFIKN